MTIIRDPHTATAQRVNKNGEALVRSVCQDIFAASLLHEKSFLLFTNAIELTTTSKSAIFYFKHNEPDDLIIDSIKIGVEHNSVDSNTTALLEIIKNPTTGTITSASLTNEVKANCSFKSEQALENSTFRKGAEGLTLTNGSLLETLFVAEGHNVMPCKILLGRGNSIGLNLTLQENTELSVNLYAVMHCHLRSDV